MTRFVQGVDRGQSTLLPECLDDWVVDDNPVRVIDAFVDALELGELGFDVEPAATGRPSYFPSTLLKLYIYGYLNRVHSSRRLASHGILTASTDVCFHTPARRAFPRLAIAAVPACA